MQSKRKPGKAGRPATGKSSSGDYGQHSVWLSNAVYAEVQRNLITDNGKRHEFSGLVEVLLRQWLKAGAKLPKD
jgi:hypothetical protein